MSALQSRLLLQVPGIRHGFGGRAEPIPASFTEVWESVKPQWKQVHGTASAMVDSALKSCGEVDALVTDRPGLPIGVVTADCVPILLARSDGRKVAAIHAGWRGTRARILRRLWEERLAPAGERPGDWVAAIGPAIGPCCYEVSSDLAEDFAREFAELGAGVAVPSHRILDLPAINAGELRALGFAEVDLLRACTRCANAGDDFLYHSFRREGGGTRNFSLIMRTQ